MYTPTWAMRTPLRGNASRGGRDRPRNQARRLTQADAAVLLGIDQSKVSRITRGQFRGVSEARLLELVAKLGHDVTIVVGPIRRRAGKVELAFV